LKKYAYIECLSFFTPESVAEIKDSDAPAAGINPFANAQYRWLLTDDIVDINSAAHGDSSELLAWLDTVDSSLVLVVPGEKVVVRQVSYHEKEKRHFAKMLPYEVEDSVIDDVESLHFSMGEKNKSQATIAYIDREWFDSAVHFFQQHGKMIERALIDFQCLQREPSEFILWFDRGRLLAHSEDGMGFATTDSLADIFLQNMLSAKSVTLLSKELSDKNSEQASEQKAGEESAGESGKTKSSVVQYKVYVSDSSAAAYTIEKATRVFHTINPDLHSEFYDRQPQLSLTNPSAIDFCTGVYAPKKNNSRQVASWKLIGILSLFSMLLFLSVNFLDVYITKEKIAEKAQAIEASYRQVIPQGVVRDPVRSLRNKLDQLAGGDGTSSEVVRLLSHVAPAIQLLDVNLLTINYNHKEKILRLSVQASSFNLVEKLRTDIEAKGLAAELLSSNAIDNKFQARLRISMEPF
jgi:general secretion pathway protein L